MCRARTKKSVFDKDSPYHYAIAVSSTNKNLIYTYNTTLLHVWWCRLNCSKIWTLTSSDCGTTFFFLRPSTIWFIPRSVFFSSVLCNCQRCHGCHSWCRIRGLYLDRVARKCVFAGSVVLGCHGIAEWVGGRTRCKREHFNLVVSKILFYTVQFSLCCRVWKILTTIPREGQKWTPLLKFLRLDLAQVNHSRSVCQ